MQNSEHTEQAFEHTEYSILEYRTKPNAMAHIDRSWWTGNETWHLQYTLNVQIHDNSLWIVAMVLRFWFWSSSQPFNLTEAPGLVGFYA